MDENETSMDDFENEAIDVEGDGEGSTGPSIEESIAAAFDELENEGTDEPEAEQGIQGNEGQEPEKPALSASEAASILAKSKGQKGKGAKRQTFEAEELKGAKGGQGTETTGSPASRGISPSASLGHERARGVS